MKSLKWILPLVALSTMLGGCPYNSSIPIDKPTVKINPALLGTWKLSKESEPGDAKEEYKVSKTDDFTYLVDFVGNGDKKSAEPFSHYKAFLSIMDTDTFVNLWGVQEKGAPENYTFYKVVLSADKKKLSLIPVTENITETFTNSESMKAFFKKYKGLSFFYGKDISVLEKQ